MTERVPRALHALLRPGRAATLAAALAMVVHIGVLANGFAFDDDVVIVGDPGIHTLEGLGTRLLQPYWPSTYGEDVGSWRPLTTAMFALVWVASGGAPEAFHAVGLLLHAAATALTVLLLWRLVAPTAALVAGLVFAVHPVHVEVVANGVGTAEALAAVLLLGAALLHLAPPAGSRIGWARGLAITLLYGAAVLAKEGAVVLPGLLLLLDAWREELRLRDALDWFLRRGWVLALQAAALGLVLLVRHSVMGAVAAPVHAPGAEVLAEIPRIWTLATVWLHWVRLLFLPATLASDYAPGVIPVQFGWSPAGVAGAVVALALLAAAWAGWRRGGPVRVVSLAVLWVVVAMLPAANIFFLAPMLLAERSLYVPSVMAAAAIGVGITALARRRRDVAVGAAVVVLVAGAVRSAVRVPTWKDSSTVAEVLLDDHPQSGRAWAGLARQLAARGEASGALQAWRIALGLTNSENRLQVEVGSYLNQLGHTASARFFLRRAWRERPTWYSAPGLLAAVELNAGRYPEAAAAARAAALLAPDNPSMHHLLAQALAGAGRSSEAAAARRRSLARGFGDRWRSWYLLARDEAAAGDTVAALAALDSAAARAADAAAVAEIESARVALVIPSQTHE